MIIYLIIRVERLMKYNNDRTFDYPFADELEPAKGIWPILFETKGKGTRYLLKLTNTFLIGKTAIDNSLTASGLFSQLSGLHRKFR